MPKSTEKKMPLTDTCRRNFAFLAKHVMSQCTEMGESEPFRNSGGKSAAERVTAKVLAQYGPKMGFISESMFNRWFKSADWKDPGHNKSQTGMSQMPHNPTLEKMAIVFRIFPRVSEYPVDTPAQLAKLKRDARNYLLEEWMDVEGAAEQWAKSPAGKNWPVLAPHQPDDTEVTGIPIVAPSDGGVGMFLQQLNLKDWAAEDLYKLGLAVMKEAVRQIEEKDELLQAKLTEQDVAEEVSSKQHVPGKMLQDLIDDGVHTEEGLLKEIRVERQMTPDLLRSLIYEGELFMAGECYRVAGVLGVSIDFMAKHKACHPLSGSSVAGASDE